MSITVVLGGSWVEGRTVVEGKELFARLAGRHQKQVSLNEVRRHERSGLRVELCDTRLDVCPLLITRMQTHLW